MDTFFTLLVTSPTESHCQPTGASLVYLVAQSSKLELVINGCANDKMVLKITVKRSSVFFIVLGFYEFQMYCLINNLKVILF